MRCYIECNRELLCIVVNWCAKQLQSVPAGTLVRSAKCSEGTLSMRKISPHLWPSSSLSASNAGLAPLFIRFSILLCNVRPAKGISFHLFSILIPVRSYAHLLGGLSRSIGGLAMGLRSRGPGGGSELDVPGRSRSGGLGDLGA